MTAMAASLKAKGASPPSNPGPIVKNMLGFDRTLIWANGGAPLSLEVFDFFNKLGILIWDGYGMSETCGPHITPSLSRHKRGTVGFGVHDVMIGNEGEILMRGPNCTMGYLYDQSKTQETINEDGWVHSGDVGSIDQDGFVTITGRLKDLIITAGGENVPPVPIEDAIKAQLPMISNAMLVGERRKFISCILTLKTLIDPNTMTPTSSLAPDVTSWLQNIGSKASSIEEVARDELALAYIQKEIEIINENSISNVHKVKKFAIISNDFSIPGGEFGPTMKLKRHVVLEKYAKEIENIYNS